MKVAPVSGDLLVKLAIAGAAVWALVYVAQRATAALPSFPVPDWSTFDPTSDQNAIYKGTSGVITSTLGYEETLGGLVYDIFHRDPTKDPLPNVAGDVGPGAAETDGQLFNWGF